MVGQEVGAQGWGWATSEELSKDPKGALLTVLWAVESCMMVVPLLTIDIDIDIDIEVAQSCLTLCNPMDSSLPGSFVHGIFLARILEWVAISFSRRFS